MTDKPSLATGADLTPETWADFVERLHYHCNGKGVDDHHTANAIFNVQARRIIYGIDRDYTDDLVVTREDCEWFSPQEYWEDADEEERADLHRLANEESGDGKGFLGLSERDQWHVLGELRDHTVTGWTESWEHVNSHFTKEAAEAFIKRKAHDYRKGLRVYVDAQIYCWEFEAIKEAIIAGRLVLAEPSSDGVAGD